MQECLPGSHYSLRRGSFRRPLWWFAEGRFWLSSPRKRTFAARWSPQSARYLRDIVPKDGGELPEVEAVRCTWQP